MTRTLSKVVILSLLLIGQAATGQAEEVFLLVPGIQGEATEKDHRGWINALSASWGHGLGEIRQGTVSKTEFGRLQIIKNRDGASVPLALAGATGQALGDLKLEITVPKGDISTIIFRVKITNARVAGYNTATQGGSSQVGAETVAFSFDTITWIGFKFDGIKGQFVPASSACWDLVNNATCKVSF